VSDRILVPLPGVGVLALAPETFREALTAGADLAAPASSVATMTAEALLDAEQLAPLLNVPATWLEQAARQGRIPSLQFGRWRRFRRSDVEAATWVGPRGTAASNGTGYIAQRSPAAIERLEREKGLRP
jgi:excisionase family DNA binding protein